MTGLPAEETAIVAQETLVLIREAHAALRMAVDALECEDENERGSVWDAVLGGVDDVSVLTKLELWLLRRQPRWRCERCGGSWQTAQEAAASTPCDVNHDPARGFVKQVLASGGSGERLHDGSCPQPCPECAAEHDEAKANAYVDGGSGEARGTDLLGKSQSGNLAADLAHLGSGEAPAECDGSGQVWLGSQPYGSPGESYAPCAGCSKCAGDEAPAEENLTEFLYRHTGPAIREALVGMGYDPAGLTALSGGEAPAGLTIKHFAALYAMAMAAPENKRSSPTEREAIAKLRAALRGRGSEGE